MLFDFTQLCIKPDEMCDFLFDINQMKYIQIVSIKIFHYIVQCHFI